MKIAVLADMHGNLPALKECIANAKSEKANAYLFLGDYLGDLPYVQETLEYLYRFEEEHRCFFLRGNKEEYWSNLATDGRAYKSTTGTMWYVYERLRKEDFAWFQSLPDTIVSDFGGTETITVCHGSPWDINRKLLHDDDCTNEILRRSSTKLIVFGHTHIRDVIRCGDVTAVNGGSVGYPQLSGGRAQYMIIDDRGGRWNWEFRDVVYDIEKVIKDIKEYGLYDAAPYWAETTAIILRTGKISHRDLLKYISNLYSKDGLEYRWPYIDERYWKKAVDYFQSIV